MSGFKDRETSRRKPVVADMISEEAKREHNTTHIHNAPTQHTYTMQQEETRSQRVQIVVKPSVNEKLDLLVKQKKIKSKNDLVNFLLESYIAQMED